MTTLRVRAGCALLNAGCLLIATLASHLTAARMRLRCIRHGHALLCGNEGHACIRCKTFWPFLEEFLQFGHVNRPYRRTSARTTRMPSSMLPDIEVIVADGATAHIIRPD